MNDKRVSSLILFMDNCNCQKAYTVSKFWAVIG